MRAYLLTGRSVTGLLCGHSLFLLFFFLFWLRQQSAPTGLRSAETLELFLGFRRPRLVNLEAGIAGGRAYLAAYSLGFGASGLTFYDAEVVRFFSPRAADEDAIFVTALGRAAPLEERVLLSTPKPVPLRRP